MAKGDNKMFGNPLKNLRALLSIPGHRRNARRAERDTKSVRLARETRGMRADPQTDFGKRVITARHRTKQLKRDVKNRKNSR